VAFIASTEDIREFLMTRRARLTPAQAGITEWGRARRVKGLKREEVAMLAGVSTEYYAKLERGNLAGVSDSVLGTLARALQLNDAERVHLFDLARAATPDHAPSTARRGRSARRDEVRPSIIRLLDSMTSTPAYVRNARYDIVAANGSCFALYAGILAADTLPLNLARLVYLDPRAAEFFTDWEEIASDVTAALRIETGKRPHDRALNELVGELSTNSREFAAHWARHDVRLHRTARKRLHSKLVGEVELTGDALELPGEDLTLIAYTAEAGSRAQQQLDFLANWSSTPPSRHAEDAPQPEEAQHTN
jgi:transcriptional regulator with XRE-family HTH domain